MNRVTTNVGVQTTQVRSSRNVSGVARKTSCGTFDKKRNTVPMQYSCRVNPSFPLASGPLRWKTRITLCV